MTLEEKIAGLILIGFRGAEISRNSPIVHDIRHLKPAGVILFDRSLAGRSETNNILSREQTTQLTGALQHEAGGGLLIAVDQEGGKVNRFKRERGFPQTPSPGALAKAGVEATSRAGEQTALLLRQLGINLNLAPVVDLDVEPDNPIIGRFERSFSSNPDIVVQHAEAWISNHRKHNIGTCLKHFPGHGSARNDSHLGFVDISTSWHPDELEPYRRLIASGLVDTVMTGHLYNRALDSDYPATLSRATVTGLLRGEMGFTGPVISDDMQMRAISERYGLAEAVSTTLAAGVDILVFGNNLEYDPGIISKVVSSIKEAVNENRLSEERINEAFAQVQKFKQRLSHRSQ